MKDTLDRLIQRMTDLWNRLGRGKVSISRPLDERRQRILAEHTGWFERELQRVGSAVTGAAPEEVQAATAKVDREHAAALRKYFSSVDAQIRTEREVLVRQITDRVESLETLVPALADFAGRYRALALDCGEWRPQPHDFGRLLHEFAEFRAPDRARTEARPPASVWQRPSSNPVVVPAE